jgi:hypothetical protein
LTSTAPGAHRHDAVAGQEAARFVVQREVQRHHSALRQQLLQLDELHARMRPGRAVPGQHAHPDPVAQPRHLGGDAPEAHQPHRLAGELQAFAPGPLAAADGAVHHRGLAGGVPHQGEGHLGHGRVAVALDGVDLDAEVGQLLRVHVRARAGAEEDDVLQVCAFPHDVGREVRVVVDGDGVAGQQLGQVRGLDVRVAVDRHRHVVRAQQPFRHRRQRRVRVHEDRAHRFLFLSPSAPPP